MCLGKLYRVTQSGSLNFPMFLINGRMEEILARNCELMSGKEHCLIKAAICERWSKKTLGEDRSSKHIKRLIEETCVAEMVHWLLLLVGPLFRLISNSVFGVIASILYSLSNVPFIMIQRYNRPRLIDFYLKILVREALTHENPHPVQQ